MRSAGGYVWKVLLSWRLQSPPPWHYTIQKVIGSIGRKLTLFLRTGYTFRQLIGMAALMLVLGTLAACGTSSTAGNTASSGGSNSKQASGTSQANGTTQSTSSTASSGGPRAAGGPPPITVPAHTLAGGLQYYDITKGTGATAQPGNTVTVNYTGWLLNGTKFDSSYDRNQPFVFVLGAGQVIPGWDEGIVGMKVGGKRRLVIPAALGYGATGAGNGLIPPNSTLIFDVQLLSVQ